MGEIHQLVLAHGRAKAKELVPLEVQHLVDLAAEMLGDEGRSLAFMYSGFAMTTLPHKQLKDDEAWERKNGPLSLLVEPGMIYENGVPVKYGVPYGSRARLIMLYLQTEALKTGRRYVHLGTSMTDWMIRMGMNPGGSNFAAVKNQINRLSACRLTVAFTTQNGGEGFKRENIVASMMRPPSEGDPRQGRLWDEVAELSEGFYNALLEHPVPCEERAIKLIQNSSSAIDVYIWLCYRLHVLKAPVTISWDKLREQFGPTFKTTRQFKHNFKRNLQEVLAVYPDANVEETDAGLRLKPSPAPVSYKKSFQVIAPDGTKLVS